MRRSIPFLLIIGLGLVYWWQKHNDASSVTSKPGAPETPKAMTSQPTPAPRGQASEYNWMKRALDRAATVRDQAREQTKESQEQP